MDKQKKFVAELVALCKKYNLKIGTGEHYDQEEQLCGESAYFYGPGIIRLELSDIEGEVNG